MIPFPSIFLMKKIESELFFTLSAKKERAQSLTPIEFRLKLLTNSTTGKISDTHIVFFRPKIKTAELLLFHKNK